MNKYYSMSEVNGEPVLYIYSPIGKDMFGESVNPKQIADELKAYNGKDVTVRINSPGGSITDGLAIYNLLNQYEGNVTCIVDGLAASMASVVAMAADDLQMPKGSFLMIHNPWTMSAGDSKQLRKDADVLENMRETLAKIYSFKTEKDIDEVYGVMDAETWIDGETAVAEGWANTLVDDMVAVASIKKDDLNKFATAKANAKLKDIMDKLEEKKKEVVAEVADTQAVTVTIDTDEVKEKPVEAPVEEQTAAPNEETTTEEAPVETEEAPAETEEDPFEIMETKIMELTKENEDLKKQLEDAKKAQELNSVLAKTYESKLADITAQLSIKTEALNSVTIDRDAQVKALKALQVRQAKALSGFKFVPENNITWKEAMKLSGGDYERARKQYPDVFDRLMKKQ